MDELILERAIAASPDRDALRDVMEKSPAWRSYCELEARRLKEKYFLSEETWQDAPLTSHLVVCYDETLMLDLSLDGKAVQEIIHAPCAALGGRSFVRCLQDALLAAQKVMNKQGEMIIRNVNETINEIFEVTGFIDILTIE